MTDHTPFEDSLFKLSSWIKTPVSNKCIVYTAILKTQQALSAKIHHLTRK